MIGPVFLCARPMGFALGVRNQQPTVNYAAIIEEKQEKHKDDIEEPLRNNMTHEEFNKIFDDLIEKCRGMRNTKGKEYANNDSDRLANFKDIAQELGVITIGDVRRALKEAFEVSDSYAEVEKFLFASLIPNPKAVLMVYMMKHVRSIEAWVKNGEISSNERIEGRIVDLITYAGLLWGLEVDSTDSIQS
jgi:polyhydroxyalkanoate synthesis regulator phasin